MLQGTGWPAGSGLLHPQHPSPRSILPGLANLCEEENTFIPCLVCLESYFCPWPLEVGGWTLLGGDVMGAGGGSLVLGEMCNQVSAKVKGGGQMGGVFAVPTDCHTEMLQL